MKDITKKYTNGEVTVVWKPAKCVHSAICWMRPDGLPEVFNPRVSPWINMEGADTDRIIEHVKKCPSGALSYFKNQEENRFAETGDDAENEIVRDGETIVQIMQNGPLLIFGNILVKNVDGSETKKSKVTSFCRCGSSKSHPYCDGTHLDGKFKG